MIRTTDGVPFGQRRWASNNTAYGLLNDWRNGWIEISPNGYVYWLFTTTQVYNDLLQDECVTPPCTVNTAGWRATHNPVLMKGDIDMFDNVCHNSYMYDGDLTTYYTARGIT